MADDITLTVRVRDLTRGEFDNVRRRMQGMGRDVRATARAAEGATVSSDRFANSLTGLQKRLSQFQRTGNLARYEMDFMRRSMGLLGRDLRRAAADGELTEDQFRNLRSELERTRLDYDHLNSSLRRHEAIAQRTARNRLERQREAERQRRADERARRAEEARVLRMGRLQAQALRMNRQFDAGRESAAQRMGTLHAQALRMDAERANSMMRLHAQALRMDRELAVSRERAVQQMGRLHAQALRMDRERDVSLRRAAAAAAEAAQSPLVGAVTRHPVWATAIAGAMVLIIGLAPALAAALSVVAGGAFIALGAFALRGSKQVKDAFSSMKDAMKSTFTDAAQPMESFLVNGMDRASSAVRQLGPAFKEAFAAAGPLIAPLVDALANLVGRMLPGMTAALRNSGPAFEGFAKAMGSIGSGIGGMFEAIAAQPEGLKRSWEVLGEGIEKVLVTFGEFLGTAANSKTALEALGFLFDALAAIIKVFDTALAVLDSTWGGFTKGLIEAATLMGPIKDGLSFLGEQMGITSDASDTASTSTKGFAESALDAAVSATKQANAVRDVIQSLRELNDQNRTNLDARANLERVIDEADKQAKRLGSADFKGGFFNLDTDKGRDAYRLVSDISDATTTLVDKLTKAKVPQDQINAAWARGREQMIALADEFGLTETQMRGVADAILAIPDRKILVQAEVQSTLEGLQAVKNKLETTRGKSFTVNALTERAQTALRALGFKIKETKGKQLLITIPKGGPIANAKAIQRAIDHIKSKSVTISVHTIKRLTNIVGTVTKALGLPYTPSANGNIMRAYANGGAEDHVAQIASAGSMRMWAEPETQGEAYIPFAPTKRPRSRAIAAETVERLGGAVEWFAGGGVRSRAKGAKDEIRAATSGSTEKRLLKLMDAIAKGTMKLASALKSVSSELTKAKDRLKDLKSTASQLASSVKAGLVGEADITKAAGAEDAQVTISTLLSKMIGSAANTKQFSSMLSQLRKRGLSKGMLRQVAEAGIEGGGMETAAALLGGGSSEIKRLNSLHSQVSKYAGSAGKTTSDAVYAAQIKSQEKLVKALDELSKALKKSVGKKATGGIIGAASGGSRGGLVRVGEQGEELVRLPYGSTVYSNPDSRRIASGGGGSQPIVVHLSLGGRHLGEILIDPLRKAISHRGGNVQASLGT